LSEWLVIAAIVVSFASGLPGLLAPRTGRACERFAAYALALAALLACASVACSFAGASREIAAAWSVPGGRLAVRVDAVSAMFVVQIAVIAALGAWYGLEYWRQREHPHDGRKLRAFYGAITAGMLLLVVARNAVLFLAGWELMALSAFLLVTTEDEKASVREAGTVYLVATRAGTLCLFAAFALLGAAAGSLDLEAWPSALASPVRDAVFVLALCGFGLKAGLMPLHVWLPGAHATAPSHVSALMSGALIKTGIYGLVRLTALCAEPPLWWGIVLVACGAVSGVLGVGFAIGQHDLKRLLAYHSIENVGIICMGLGVAVLGRSLGRPELVALGAAGALLHVWNHGLFKALLFLSAGAVLHATGTREIDRLGGLGRRMPRTAVAFLIGAVAICGLPPLNGLVSEFLVYLGLFRMGALGGTAWLAGALGAPALAAIGALALACFVKAYGAVFLGRPRTEDVERAHEVGWTMLAPMAVLASACLLIGLAAPAVARILDVAVRAWAGPQAAPSLDRIAPLVWVSLASAALLLAVLLVGALLATNARADRRDAVTWDCGYAVPGARTQYTASSFAEMLVGMFAWALRPTRRVLRVEGPFPGAASFHARVPEAILELLVQPTFAFAGRVMTRLRPLQRGSVHLYLLYILATLLVLLLWR
jgi:hydrogenase-4 component B